MRKVLSWVLVLALVLGSFSMAFAASSYTDVAGTPSEEAVTVLSDLGVVNGYEDGTYQPGKVVTRAEAAKLIISALGVGNMASGTATFSDMAGYEWAAGFVGYAQNLGLLKGYEDGTFRPGNTVSYQEWATILVRALGYTDQSLPGTWPASYVTKAQGLGIFDDVSAVGTAGANRGDIAIMLYNTIDLSIGTVNKDDEWVANAGKVVGGVNLGDRMIFKLGADNSYQTLITGDEQSAINLKPYIGTYGTVYVKGSKVLAVADIKSEFIKGDFDLAKGTFKGDDDVDYSIKDTSVTVQKFLNGSVDGTSAVSALVAPYLTGATVSVKVSGKSITDMYAVMKWSATDARKVDKFDIADISEDKELLGASFTTLRNGEIDKGSFILAGVSSLDKIAVDNVVAVYTEKALTNKDITKVEVGTEVVTGEVTKVTTGATPKYTINGKEYKMSTLPGADAAPALGDEVKAFLDFGGKIYKHTTTGESTNKYAVVLKAPGSSGGYTASYQVKLLTADGAATVYTFNKKANYDDAVADGVAKGDIVSYKVNSSDKLTEVKVANSGTFAATSKLSSKGVIQGMLLADTAVVFTKKAVASGGNADGGTEDYDVVKVSSVSSDKAVGANFYATNSKGKVVAMIVGANTTGAKDTFGVLSSWAKVKNSDGDSVYELKAILNGEEKVLLTEDDSDSKYDLKTGAFMKFEFDGDEVTLVDDASLDAQTVIQDSIADNTVVVFDNGEAADASNIYAIGTAKAYKIQATDGDRIQLGNASKAYQVVSDANVYYPTFDSDDDFDGWKITSAGNLARDGYVILLQTDEDSDNWDTVLYIKKADVAKTIAWLS